MQTNDLFKIVIGDGWRTDLPRRSGRAPSRSEPGIDFAGVRDVVDIIVDGDSICGRTDEDSIFFLVRDLLFAVEQLAVREEPVRVSFYAGPWELVLQRVATRVYITFYRGDRRPLIVVKDKNVAFADLARGVIASAAGLVDQAVEIEPDAESDPVVHGIRAALGRVRAIDLDSVGRGAPPTLTSKLVESTRWPIPRGPMSFSFGFRFAATVTDLLAPGKPHGSDLNALLFKGQHAVHARGKRLALGSGFLFLQTELLLSSLRDLLASWEEGRPLSERLIAEGLVVGVRLGRDDGLDVSLMDSARKDAILVLNHLTPWEYADAVLGAARELKRLIIEVSPAQRHNLRLEAFGREVKVLAAWAKEQRRGGVVNKNVDRYRNLAEPRRPRAPAALDIGATSRLRFQERWRIEVEGLDLRSTMLCGDRVLIGARNSMLCAETATGGILWRREFEGSDARFALAGPEGVVRAGPSGDIEMLDLESGTPNWQTVLAPRSGGAPVLLVMDHGPSPGLIIAAEEERRLVALDRRSGELRWRFSASRGGRFALRRYGRLLYVASNDSHFNAIDAEDGTLVWRLAERTRFSLPPAVVGDAVLAVGGRPGRIEGKLWALNAYSGELLWTAPLSGGAMTAPIVADGVALVPIRVGRRYEFVGIDVADGKELWRRVCAGWADASALMALDNRFIINSAGGNLYAIGARDGQEIWNTALGPACSDDVPLSLRVVLRGGMLFVPADTVYVVRPEDGRIIHTLGSDAPVPDMLQVDPDCAVFVAEDSGHVAMYSLASQLRVVT